MTRSFADLALTEAIARRLTVWLVVGPPRPGSDGRLRSRLLAARGPDELILDVPRARGRKVFVSTGSVVGMAFSMCHAFLQARTTVRGHCQFPLYPTRRVDAVIVDRPETMIAAERREHVRLPVDPSRHIPASMWPVQALEANEVVRPRSGRLLNYSPNGLGIRLEQPLSDEPGTEMLIRLEETGAEADRLFRGTLVQCSLDEEGLWLAGFGQVAELAPGEEVELTRSIAATAE